MWELALALALGDPEIGHETLAAPIVGVYATHAQCDAALERWWKSQAVPEGYEGWHQFMPGSCDPVEPLVG